MSSMPAIRIRLTQPGLFACFLLSVSLCTLSDAAEQNDSARWEKAISAFEQAEQKNPPQKNGLLFVGSSSIRFWDLPKYFPDRGYINRGFGGSQIADSVYFAERIILKHEPRLVVVYAGDNDIAAGKTPEIVHADFKRLVKTIHDTLPETKIVFIAIKPSLRRWKLVEPMREANRLIEEACGADPGLAYLDIFTPMLGDDGKPKPELFVKDGLHLSDTGYQLWSKLLLPLIDKDGK